MTPRHEMEAAIEAVLFVSSEPVLPARLLELFDEEDREGALAALETVLERYRGAEGRGVMVDEVAGGVRLVSRPELAGWLRRFFEVRGGTKLSMAALETLAIVAYRQPVTVPEIQELRSVNPSGVLKTLLERRLVRIAGRKAVVGSPFLYRTSKEFLVHFGLQDLTELPPLEEFEEAFTAGGGTIEEEADDDREEAVLRAAAELEEAEEEEPDGDEGAEGAAGQAAQGVEVGAG